MSWELPPPITAEQLPIADFTTLLVRQCRWSIFPKDATLESEQIKTLFPLATSDSSSTTKCHCNLQSYLDSNAIKLNLSCKSLLDYDMNTKYNDLIAGLVTWTSGNAMSNFVRFELKLMLKLNLLK